MKILLTNDDGVFAAGIFEIAKQLYKEHQIFIVAPDSQRSGASQSISIHNKLFLKKVELEGLPDAEVYSLTGTPADCVKFGVGTLGIKPDLIISGMNMGANLGTDVMYSGTVGAATEAALLGYPSLALSVCSHKPSYIADAALLCKKAVDFYLDNLSICKLLSVNVPDLPYSAVKGVIVTHLSKRNYPLEYVKQEDGSYKMPEWIISADRNADNDERYISDGYVTWTPLLTDLCDCEKVCMLKALLEKDATA